VEPWQEGEALSRGRPLPRGLAGSASLHRAVGRDLLRLPGRRSGIQAAQILMEAGFTRVRTLKGGWQAWLAAGGPVEQKPKT